MNQATHSLTESNKGEFCFKELEALEKEIDWDFLVKDIYPHYVKSILSPVSVTVESMIRVNILVRYFQVSPASIEKLLLEVESFQRFSLITLCNEVIPEASSIKAFNAFLKEKNLEPKLAIIIH